MAVWVQRLEVGEHVPWIWTECCTHYWTCQLTSDVIFLTSLEMLQISELNRTYPYSRHSAIIYCRHAIDLCISRQYNLMKSSVGRTVVVTLQADRVKEVADTGQMCTQLTIPSYYGDSTLCWEVIDNDKSDKSPFCSSFHIWMLITHPPPER